MDEFTEAQIDAVVAKLDESPAVLPDGTRVVIVGGKRADGAMCVSFTLNDGSPDDSYRAMMIKRSVACAILRSRRRDAL